MIIKMQMYLPPTQPPSSRSPSSWKSHDQQNPMNSENPPERSNEGKSAASFMWIWEKTWVSFSSPGMGAALRWATTAAGRLHSGKKLQVELKLINCNQILFSPRLKLDSQPQRPCHPEQEKQKHGRVSHHYFNLCHRCHHCSSCHCHQCHSYHCHHCHSWTNDNLDKKCTYNYWLYTFSIYDDIFFTFFFACINISICC